MPASNDLVPLAPLLENGMGSVPRRAHSPPFQRRGGCAIKQMPRSFLIRADEVVSKKSRSLLINIRVAHLIFVGIYEPLLMLRPIGLALRARLRR